MKLYYYLLPVLLLLSCVKEQDVSNSTESQSKDAVESRFNKIEVTPIDLESNARGTSTMKKKVAKINRQLLAQNAGIQISKVEYYGHEDAGNTVFFNDRGNKRLNGDFVPNDPRRLSGDNIDYAQDGTEASTTSGLSAANTIPAINRAMNTWDGVTCSKGLDIIDIGVTPFDLGYVQWLIGAGGAPLFTDLMHSGFSTAVTDAIFGPGSSVLGVTFTFNFIDENGDPTDIDNNGKVDVAFRDIYYNDAFPWAIGSNIDVETVALHEAGHGLSQGHFGKLFQDNGAGEFHFAPRAVMNAGYTGVQTSIGKTDKAGHCSNWGQWPNK